MPNTSDTRPAKPFDVQRIVSRLMPVVLDDADYLAVVKPPRIELTDRLSKRGPTLLQTLLNVQSAQAGQGRSAAAPVPLILPERLSSGLALFARSAAAADAFAASAASRPIEYSHLFVVRGKLGRRVVAIKPGSVRVKEKPRPRSGPDPDAALPPARLTVLLSAGDLHVVRCMTRASALDDLRRMLKSVGLTIAGDVRPPMGPSVPRIRRSRRILMHLEELRFRHPATGKTESVSGGMPPSFQSYVSHNDLLDENLSVALANRLSCLLDDTTDCFRLMGADEGVSGLAADCFGPVVILETLQGKYHGGENQLRQIANWYRRMLGVRTIYAKVMAQSTGAGSGHEKGQPPVSLLHGEPVSDLIVRENGLRFIIHPESGLSAGLFCDQRDNRRRVRSHARGKQVLNLFAYTCGFSVAAAAGGAASTVSVDVSVRNLEWGKRNFAANDLSLEDHLFIRDDAFEYFKRARRQQRRFDLMILDPPSFARSKKPRRAFEIKKHLGELIAESLTVLARDGQLLISTNNRQLSANWLAEQVTAAANRAGRRFVVESRPQLPVDFAPDPAYQKSIWVRFL